LHWLGSTPLQLLPHDVPRPTPSQPGRLPTGWPLVVLHVPTLGATLQASHCLSHARSQQTPSTHRPEMHSAPAAHAVPLFFEQVPASAALPLQVAPGPHDETLQQTPSVQYVPAAHPEAELHEFPRPDCFWQLPPLQK
jgi:hypothetical protein